MKHRRIISCIAALVFLPLSFLTARGLPDDAVVTDESADVLRIIQAGSAAFIVGNALYLFPDAPERIVAMADGNQGNGFFPEDFDTGFDDKVILPRSANTEAIAALRPDVVVMKNFLAGRMGEPLEQVGIPTFYLDLETPEAWMADLDRLGMLFGDTTRADELKDLFRKRMTAVEDSLAGLSDADRPRVLFLYWSVKDGASAVNVPPLGWMQTRLVELAGGTPVWKDADLGERWTKVNLEQIAAWDPDAIVVAAYHIPAQDAVDAIQADPVWTSLRAVAAGRLYAVPADYHSWDQPDARWLLGMTWMASVLHPDRFSDIEMESEVREFYRDFFAMDDAAFDRMIAPRLAGLD